MDLIAPVILLAAMMLIMAFAWGIQRLTGNSGWVDALWTFGTGAVIAGGVLVYGAPGLRSGLIAALAVLWALRLGGHIAARTAKSGEDPRYAALMEEWGPAAPLRLFLFLQAQALASGILALSALAAALNPAPHLSLWDALALLVALGAIAGEGLADRQLQQAKAAGERICMRGLWGWSRHPNYFFEFLFWCALPLFALGGGGLLLALSLLAPALMYGLLAHVSGVPPLEAHMLRKHGEAFRAYQARVSVFWPLPPRKSDLSLSNRSA